jgi:hypothetical protein
MNIKLIPFIFLLSTWQYLPAIGQVCQPESEKFDTFYNRFTTDSAFQISRVIFPLKGAKYFLNYMMEEDSIPWIKDKWEFSRINIYKLDTIRYGTEINVQESDVDENIWTKNSGLGMERRFKLMSGKWYLVYFLFYST